MRFVRIIENRAFQSLRLHYLHETMQENERVQRAKVLQGTEANKEYLNKIGLSDEMLTQAQSNDLVVVAEIANAADEALLDELIQQAEKRIRSQVNRQETQESEQPLAALNKRNYLTRQETKSPFFFREFSDERKMGRVHSVFRSSFNVTFDDQLLNFSSTGMAVSPHGCVLNAEKLQPIVEKGEVGDIVKLENKQFTFYMKSQIITLDLADVTETDVRLPRLSMPIQEVTDTGTYKVLDQIAFDEHLGLDLEGKVGESIQTLQAVSQNEPSSIEQAFQTLIGRGNGLTPSGDDILLGYFMCRRAFGTEEALLAQLEKGLEKSNTTAISMAYYESLLAGYVNSLFLGLIHSVELAEEERAEKRIRLITRYGHTSGYDTLFGFYLGLQSLDNEKDMS